MNNIVSNPINNNLIVDLEIFDKILPELNMTFTRYGTYKLKNMLSNLNYTKTFLDSRQYILKQLHANYNVRIYIIKELENIQQREKSITWLFENNNQDLYFRREYFNYSSALNFSNFMTIYTPSINIIIYLIIYLVMVYIGIPISLTEYLKNMYYGYSMFVENILNLVTSTNNLNSFISHSIVGMYCMYQLYTSAMSIQNSINHYRKCRDFKNKMIDIYYLIDSISNVYEIDFLFDKHSVESDIQKLKTLFSFKKLSNLGYLLSIKKQLLEYDKSIFNALQYISNIDAHISIVNLIICKGYTFPIFDYDTNKPYIIANNVWNPLLDQNQITNDFIIGIERLMIITGANTSGKSTYMRNAMLSVYLSQTLGVSCCSYIVFTPFKILFTYINIPDVVGRESLFEAEMNRCMEYINMVKKLDMNQYAFAIIDELFTGTNPKEGIAGSYAVCDYMLQYNNSLLTISTHFHDITKLKSYRPSLVINKQFKVDIVDGIITKPYTVSDGVSTQNIAIHLLKNKGFDPHIINLAQFYASKT